jgi:hypothetical protein
MLGLMPPHLAFVGFRKARERRCGKNPQGLWPAHKEVDSAATAAIQSRHRGGNDGRKVKSATLGAGNGRAFSPGNGRTAPFIAAASRLY